MIIKIIIGIILFFISFVISVIYSNKYVERKNFYNDLFIYILDLKKEIEFSHKTIDKIETENKDLKTIINNILNKEKIKYPTYLLESDITLLKNIFNTFGQSDSKTELEILSSKIKDIEELKNITENQHLKKTKNIIKIGVLIGLILFIIVI